MLIASRLLRSLVPKRGLEPPHPCEYMDLNHARLPIPPFRHGSEHQAGAVNFACSLLSVPKLMLPVKRLQFRSEDREKLTRCINVQEAESIKDGATLPDILRMACVPA